MFKAGLLSSLYLGQLFQTVTFLAFFLGIEASFLKFVTGNCGLHSLHDETNAFLNLDNLLWERALLKLGSRTLR